MRPSHLICDVFIDEVFGCLDHVPDQILSYRLAQFAEAIQALGFILDLLLEPLAHLHAQLIGVEGRSFGPPTFELDMLAVVFACPPEPLSDGPGVADKSCGFLGGSPLVGAGLDLGCQPKLALVGIGDLNSGVSQQILHLWNSPKLC